MPELIVNGVRLHYRRSGQGDPLLLLHGLGSSSRDWEHQLDALSARFEVIVPDLRGHGRSDKPPGPYSVALFASDIAEFMRMLGLGAAHLVGLSMGGMLAFQLALDHPQSVRSLIIVNSAPELVPRGLKQRWQFARRRWIVRLLGMRRMGKVLADQLLPEPGQRHLHAVFIERWAENDPRAYLASLDAIVGWSVIERIAELRVPCLVVSADADYTPIAAKRAWAALIPGAELAVICNSRHMTPLDQAQAFNEALIGFLSQQPHGVNAAHRSS